MDIKYLTCDRMIELLKEVSNKGFGSAYVIRNEMDNLSILTPHKRKEDDDWPFGDMIAYIDMDDNGSVEWTINEDIKPVSRKEAITIANKIFEDAEKERSAKSELPWRTDSPPKDGTKIVAEFQFGIFIVKWTTMPIFICSEDLSSGWSTLSGDFVFRENIIRWREFKEP